MRQPPLLSNPDAWPHPANADRAALGRERWLERGKREAGDTLKAFAKEFVGTPAGVTVLDAVFGNSPYLGDCLLKEMTFFRDLLMAGPEAMADTLRDRLFEKAAAAPDGVVLKRLLRETKRQSALLIAPCRHRRAVDG